MSWFKPQGLLDDTYEVSLIIKGADGALELIGAALLFFISPTQLNHIVSFLTQHELSRDPHDFIATHILHAGQHLTSGGMLFAAVYLFAHGIIKIFLVVSLLLNQMWAYPLSIAVTGAFIVYQVYRLTFAYSLGLVLLTIFDIFVIWLIWREFRKQKEIRRGS